MNFPYVSVLLVCLPLLNASLINLEENGYKGIIVAIRNTIKEDPQLIENIKKLFKEASEFLHTTTRGQTYFKEITIAVPSTWSNNDEYQQVLSDYFSSAHIRIDKPNPEYGDAPYTLQTGGCGEPGQYIHLTPNFVKNINGEIEEKYGPLARQLVHEWAHLRYGVFDEYGIPGDPRFPMFYQDSGKIYPTSCIKNIKGWIESKIGGPCQILEGGYIDKDCIFIPDMHHQDVTASIMYMPFIPSMDGFCDKTDERFHNVRAPTKQNALCHYRSTWNIIASHPDFNKRNRTARQADDLTNILFRIVKHGITEEGRFVLVLDVSGSMNGQPIKLLHQAATRFVEDRIPNGAYLGIVQFSTSAKILHSLTKVTNDSRHELSSSLPDKDDGGTTAIGRGLEKGIEVLKNDKNGIAEGGMIILITDGEENVTPFISEKIPSLLKEKIIVNTVAFGGFASHKLENLTKITGGKGFFFRDLNGTRPTSDLDAAFLESVTSHADIDLQPVKIADEMIYFSVTDEVHKERKIWLDKELGKNTIFIFLSTIVDGFEVEIIDPNNKLYNEKSIEFSKDTGLKNRIQITIPQAQSGQWTIQFRKTTHLPIPISMTLTSEPKDVRDQPIRVRSWISDFQLDFPAHAKLYAEVKKSYNAVINAKVIATVERPMGKPVDVVLKDSGAGADVLQNDGIYSAYFTHFNGNGRYAVVANVINDGDAKLKHGSKSSAALPIPKFSKKKEQKSHSEPTSSFPLEDFIFSNKSQEEVIDAEPLEQLQRISETGAFRVENWDRYAKDIIPPGNITDLIVLSTNIEKKHVVLKWTSPGGNLDDGNASSIELRSDFQPEILLSKFNQSFLYDSSYVISGTLKPLPAGEVQIVTIMLPDVFLPTDDNFNKTIYFAVRAIDENENISPGYNLAIANFRIYDQNEKSKTKKDSFKWWPAVIGIGIAILLMIALLIGLVIIFHKKKNHKFEKIYCE